MKRIFMLSVILGLSVLLAWAAPAVSQQPKRGGTLTMAIRKDLTTMNPLVRTMSTDQSIRELIYESLLSVNAKGAIEPKVAESWEVSKDGKTYIFKLRAGVKFHNGQEVTAKDLAYAIDYTMNPKNGAYGRQRLTLIKSVEATDKHTLKFNLKRQSAAFLSVLTDIQAFSVIPAGSIQEVKPNAYPPGTGPFRFASWQPKQQIVFERNDDYWGEKTYLDRVVMRPIPNDTVRFTALRAGDVDLIERAPYEWVNQILAGKIKGIGTAKAATAGYRAMFFNVAAAPFNDIRMRQAVAHAIDKKELMEATFYGFGEPVDQKYPKGYIWHIEGLPWPEFNLDKSRALLKEAGYKGEPIEMKIEQGHDVEVMTTTLQAQLKRIGLNVKPQVFEYGARREQIRRGETTFDFVGSDYYVDPAPTYSTETACEPDLKKRSSNWTGYCNKELDKKFEQLETELDQEKRVQLLKEILTVKAKDIPTISIGFVPRFFALGPKVKGFVADDDGAFVHSEGGLTRVWLDQ